MPFLRLSVVLAAAFTLGACAIGTPFRGPGYDPAKGVTIEGQDKLVIGVTNAVLSDDPAMRTKFWSYMTEVEATLSGRPGFVGHAKRRELLGDEVWTVSVWADENSLVEFVQSEAHQAAIRQAIGALDCFRTGRFEINRQDVPISWDRAAELLDTRDARCG